MTVPRTFVVQGDCVDVLRTFPDASISAVVTDPPYGLSKEPDMVEVLRHWLDAELVYRHRGGGFMGKTWDSFVPGPEVWREVLRVLKPGGHALVFSGTRTYDLTVLAMRIAGFEIRDQLAWLYGTGFPKSLDVSKAIAEITNTPIVESPHQTNACPDGQWCRCDLRDERAQSGATKHPSHRSYPDGSLPIAWHGWGTALKPAQEPIVLARKPLIGTVAANIMQHGTGGLNVDGCKIGRAADDISGCSQSGSKESENGSMSGKNYAREPKADAAGRWPANVLMDEDAAAMLDEQSGISTSPTTTTRGAGHGAAYNMPAQGVIACHGDTGGASRFFYVAKASKAEREAGLDHLPIRTGGDLTDRKDGSAGSNSPRAGAGRGGARRNHHPTVKPIELMRYLIRMITPPGGMVLDPFAGSGSTLCAAVLEGVSSVGIELTPEYLPIIEGRIAHYKTRASKAAAVEQLAGTDARKRFEADQ